MYNIKVTHAEKTRFNDIDWDNLGFGRYFSDHMYMSEYKDGKWSDGEILPYGPIPMEPSTCALHYGQSIFEGLKAYRCNDGSVNLFRPLKNASRLNHSGSRLVIPPFNEDLFVEALTQLVKIDSKFVPSKRGTSLYIRPLVFGDGAFLGVHASATYKHIIMTSPVASYYPEGLSPVKILVDKDNVRAVRGGLGTAKTAGNYAASLLGSETAKKQGYSQVLWLDAISRHFVDEVGAMNIMFVINNELVTPPLGSGSILAGVTRDTVLQLAHTFGIPVSERQISVEEVFEANSKGELQEIFGTGTAAVISPVGQLSYGGEQIVINNMEIGPLAQRFYDTITGIQYGDLEDKYGWTVKIK
ncbi:MAG TPA: branched-chain amino acid aminotransferase [Candidatus Kapabacteria bacterium]|nr:branched-chain amino acid aminotransferase [Candidatus Kapabacteria bacterium]